MPGWLIGLTVIVGAMAIRCAWLLIGDCWRAFQQGLADARTHAELREMAERRKAPRADGRINRRTR